jgi:fructose 1,6-bisphosphate aldolase/phosphatase
VDHKITLSIIKADVGSVAGRHRPHPDRLQQAEDGLAAAMAQTNPTRLDGPPRAVALAFQMNHGQRVGPIDRFDDGAFDRAREQAPKIADLRRRRGPCEAHRLPLEEMESTTLPRIMGRLADRFQAE